MHNEAHRLLKAGDFLMDQEQAAMIFDQPVLVFKKVEVVVAPVDQESMAKKDPTAIFIEKLYNQMKSSKHFPNSLRELERQIKKNLTKKSD